MQTASRVHRAPLTAARARRARLALLVLLAAASLAACGPPDVETDPRQRAAAPPPAPTWEKTLEQIVPCVVSLNITMPRVFDTSGAGAGGGTGFIVDKEQGLILTNRHLVLPGPVISKAVLYNHEELDLHEVYYDPVHDFGFYRFDPEQVRFAELCELPLAPEAARVGLDIRVVGNDAGEKISILSGTLARLDRAAPDYGRGTYNDFNTFYYQAASGTSGGSSGSPVLDVEGRVIALNAGGSVHAASSFYLPLNRVVRALDHIQRGEQVPRGTLQTVFTHQPYQELRRLQLSDATEAEVRARFPQGVGMLVVDDVVPDGPAHDALEPGDVLVRLNGELINDFLSLESVLDSSVGGPITLLVERGGARREVSLVVDDLHALSPSEYIEVGQGVIHPLSYQQARNYNVPAEGLYITSAGHMLARGGVRAETILRSVNNTPVPDLDVLWRVLTTLPDGERVVVRYSPLDDIEHEMVAAVPFDRRWFRMQRCARDPDTGAWPCTQAPDAPPPQALSPAALDGIEALGADRQEPVRSVARSLALVDFKIPYNVEGVWGTSFRGTGLIVDAERGLIVVDRDTVPIALGDIEVTFAGAVRVPGQVSFIHPVHNFALISYDPALVVGLPIEAAVLDAAPLSPGDDVWQVALDSRGQPLGLETEVARAVNLEMPIGYDHAMFRDANVEVLELEQAYPSIGGVLADDRGRVRALWHSFHVPDGESVLRGVPVELLQLILDRRDDQGHFSFRTLGVELGTLALSDARDLGLPGDWVSRLAAHDPRREVLRVLRTYRGFPAEDTIEEGDVLLAVASQPVTRFIDLERATQAERVSLTVLRGDQVLELDVPTVALAGRGVTRVLNWAGMLVHDPHLEVASQRGVEREGVYTAWYWYGTPAHRYGLPETYRVVEVNGVPTPDLDAFIAAIKPLDDRDAVRIKALDFNDTPNIFTLELDLQYWPTELIEMTDDGWRRVPL